MRSVRTWLFTALALAPRAALACPACARDNNSVAVTWLIGGMMLAPLVLGGIVFAVARRFAREEPQP